MSDFEDYQAQQTLRRGLSSNKLISACIFIALVTFFGVIYAEKNNLFADLIPMLRDEVKLPDGYILTAIDKQYPILIKKNDPRMGPKLQYEGSVSTLFDTAAYDLCRKNDHVVEVGAHYGYNSIMLGRIVSGAGSYIAIEGNTLKAKCLYKNVVLNDLDRVVTVVPKAASDHTGTCILNEVTSLEKDSSGEKREVIQDLNVPCDTLDNLLQDRLVSFVLINSSSSVFPTLRGATELIEKSNQIKILADIDLNKVPGGINPQEELQRLSLNGFRFYRITEKEGIQDTTIEEIIQAQKAIVIMAKGQ